MVRFRENAKASTIIGISRAKYAIKRAMFDALEAKTVPTVQSSPRSKGAATRARILDLAYERIIDKGFAATSIEELVEAGGLTKSGFFYHFRDKNDLARQLIDRYVADDESCSTAWKPARANLHEDPLHAFLIFLKLYAEMMERDAARSPRAAWWRPSSRRTDSFDAGVRARSVEIILGWRQRFHAWLEEIAVQHPPRLAASTWRPWPIR
jgi:TetR/AcrR family transcriptional repressor of nem operon